MKSFNVVSKMILPSEVPPAILCILAARVGAMEALRTAVLGRRIFLVFSCVAVAREYRFIQGFITTGATNEERAGAVCVLGLLIGIGLASCGRGGGGRGGGGEAEVGASWR